MMSDKWLELLVDMMREELGRNPSDKELEARVLFEEEEAKRKAYELEEARLKGN